MMADVDPKVGPQTFVHHTLAGVVAECTCRWVSEPAGSADAARALATIHMREEHP